MALSGQSGGQGPPGKERTWHQRDCKTFEGVREGLNGALFRALCCPFRIKCTENVVDKMYFFGKRKSG